MNLACLASGTSVFVDANVLVYHLGAHRDWGSACTAFVQRIEQGDL